MKAEKENCAGGNLKHKCSLFMYLIYWKISFPSTIMRIEMTFERKWNVASKKKRRGKCVSQQVAKRKLFITFIRYQNVNNSMIKWPSGDINRDELFLPVVFMITERNGSEDSERQTHI